jgi:hypothetical protein
VPFISKSKYLAGLQCQKLLWYYYNAKEEIPPPDAATQAIFDQGHEVGELAKSLFPGGIEVAKGIVDFARVLPQSLEAIKLRKPLFEAAFAYKNAFARADVLNPVGKDQWDIIEVKSSTQVKDVNILDLALQRYTYEGAGLKIRNCILMYIDNQYVRKGRIDPKKLFGREDITKQVAALMSGVEGNLKGMADVIRLKKYPAISIGPQCSDPYECPLQDICWQFLPEDNVFTLYKLGQKGFDLLKEGVEKIVEIPETFRLTGTQRIQQETLKSRRPHIDKEALASFLKGLEYPLFFLDFETFGTALPLFDEVRPYQQIPFQFSLHIVRSGDAQPEHHSFLAGGSTDPRPEILSRLQGLLGTKGSIVSYNAPFERGRIKESCEAFPKFATWWERTVPRVVDLLEPFRAFSYYHPDQEGSASMKAVLPALTGKSYEGMAIADGGDASREYLRVTFGKTPTAEKEKVRKQLEEYCGLDTSGMVAIVDALRKLVTDDWAQLKIFN